MSLILDALKKADQERQNNEASPSLESRHPVDTSKVSPQKKPWVTIAAIGISLFIIVVLIILWFNQKPKINQTTSTPQVNTNKVITTRTSTSKNTPKNVPEKNTSLASKLARANEVKQLTQKKLIAAQYSKDSNKANEKNNEINNLYKQEAQTKKNLTTKNQPKPITKEKATTKEETNPNKIASYSNIKRIKELPFSVQEKISTLIYSEHHFSPDGRSNIVINGKKVQANSTISSGIRLEKILEDGILLKYESYEFKMIALNSWLNY